MRITFRDRSAAHQLNLKFETSTGRILALCNCGERLLSPASVIEAEVALEAYRLHLSKVLSLKSKLNHRGR
jgi:hypothetical protein